MKNQLLLFLFPKKHFRQTVEQQQQAIARSASAYERLAQTLKRLERKLAERKP